MTTQLLRPLRAGTLPAARRPVSGLTGLALLACMSGCAMAPSDLPDTEHLVVVKAVRIPERSWLPWYTRFADHLWVDIKGSRGWVRVEWNQRMDHVGIQRADADWVNSDDRWGRQVKVLEFFTGDRAAIMGKRILTVAPSFPFRKDYRAWPGPNSNTFIAWLANEVSGMAIALPTTAVGKDYAPWVRVGFTTTRTGLELETPLLGIEAGLREGLELHFLGLTIGVGIWPPAIKLPFLPGIPFGLDRRGSAR